MRYLKGSLDLKFQDREMLHLVADAQFVTHRQLFQFMRLKTYESKRAIFNWRARRLVNNGLLRKLVMPHLGSNSLYAITENGIEALEVMGVTYLGGYVEHEKPPQQMRLSHLLEINQIRLTLETAGVLVSWTAEAFIRVLNSSPSLCHAKTYDAVIKVNLGDNLCSNLAIEYERSLKAEERYENIVRAIADETRVQAILYLTSSFEIASPLRRHFRNMNRKVLLAQLEMFKKHVLDTEVDLGGSYVTMPLREALREKAHK